MKLKENDKGTILVIAAWIISILTIIALGFSYRMGIGLKTEGMHIGKTRSHYLAKSAVLKMMQTLENDKTEYDSLNEPWANNITGFKDYSLSAEMGTFSIACVRAVKKDTKTEDTLFYGAIDEESKINVAAASEQTIKEILRQHHVDTDISDTIIDWTDTDNNERYHGAEEYYYQSLPVSYHCRNGQPEMMNELLLIKGITKKVFASIKDRVTVYGAGKININTADEETLQLLGCSPQLAEKIRIYRNGPDEVAGTFDDGIFTHRDSIIEDLEKIVALNSGEKAQLVNIKPLLTVKSYYFRIQAIGISPNNIKTRITVVVFRPQNGTTRILSWEEE